MKNKNMKKPNAFIEIVKNLAANKKFVVLIALLIAVGVAKAMAEEKIAEIMFPVEESWSSYMIFYTAALDTNGDKVVDRNLRFILLDRSINSPYRLREMTNDDRVNETLKKYYIKEGLKFVFDDKGLKPFDDFSPNRIIGIIVDGKYSELSQMFSATVVKEALPYLWDKAVREGRVKN
jgi:hypothetical protein